MADYDVLVFFELHEEPEWTYVECIGASAMDPLPLETAEDLYEEEEEDFAHLTIPGHLFLLMSGRLPAVPESSFAEDGDVDELPSDYPNEPPTYFLYVRNIDAFQEWCPSGAGWAILQVVELRIVANILETPINRGLRICDDCADPDASPILRTCRSAHGSMNIFGCLTTQLGEGLGLRHVRNVVKDMQT